MPSPSGLLKPNTQKGVLFGLLGAMAFSTYVVINRHVYATYDVAAGDYTVTFLAAGALFALVALACRPAERKRPFTKNALPVFGISLLAATALALTIVGQRYTTAINTSLIVTATIVTTGLFSGLILREKFSSAQLRWMVLLFVGLYFGTVGAHLLTFNKGDLIILAGCVIFGFTNTISRALMKGYSSHFIADMRLIVGGLFFGLIGLLLGGADILVTSAGLWPILAGLFVWINVRLFYTAINYLGANKAIVVVNSHVFFTIVAGIVLLAEPYSWIKFVGALVVLTSIYFISRKGV